jgi:hypothetical protein
MYVHIPKAGNQVTARSVYHLFPLLRNEPKRSCHSGNTTVSNDNGAILFDGRGYWIDYCKSAERRWLKKQAGLWNASC